MANEASHLGGQEVLFADDLNVFHHQKAVFNTLAIAARGVRPRHMDSTGHSHESFESSTNSSCEGEPRRGGAELPAGRQGWIVSR